MSKKLEDIRKKIDTLDNKIHDLLMERAGLVSDVAEEKKKQNLQIVHPAREAMMIRRLLGRHQGPLPEAAVVRIWRELVGAVSLLQSGLHVCVAVPQGHEEYWDMARNYFGSVIPMKRVSEPLYGVSSVRDDESSFAVLPWPEDGDEKGSAAWWSYILEQGSNPIRIVGALPYGCAEKDKSNAQTRALILSKSEYMESGDDHSFIAVSVDPTVSRGRIFDVLSEMGAQPLSIHTQTAQTPDGLSHHLVEVNVFMEEDDERLTNLAQKFEEQRARCILVGGYPVPPTFKPLNITLPKAKDTPVPPPSKKADKAA